jgi:hypothetical protein
MVVTKAANHALQRLIPTNSIGTQKQPALSLGRWRR